MKNIIKSLLVVVAVAAVAGGATYAYFSSDVTVTGNTIATGTLKINDKSQDWMQQVTFDNLKPGSLIRKWVVIENDGTLDVGTLNVSVANLNDTNGLLDQLTGWT